MDAAVGADDLQKSVGVCGLELGILAVLQHRVDDGVLPAELFQHFGVGGVAGLGLFSRRQAQALKEHLSQLLGGIDVEGAAGHLVDGRLQVPDPSVHGLAEPAQLSGVHPEAGPLHLRQHPAKGQLRGLIELPHLLLLQKGRQLLIQSLHRRRVGVKGGLGLGGVPAQGGEGLRLQVEGLGQLRPAVGQKQPGQIIAARRGIQEIGGQGRVKHKALRRQSVFQQQSHEILDVVGDLLHGARKEGAQQGVPVPLVPGEEELRRHRLILPGPAGHHHAAEVRQRQHRHMVCALPLLHQSFRLGRLRHLLHLHREVRLFLRRRSALPRPQAQLVDELGEL